MLKLGDGGEGGITYDFNPLSSLITFCQEIIVEPVAVERRLLHPITAAAEQNSLQ